MKRAQEILHRISSVIAWVGIGLTLTTMVMYSIDVFGRLIFSSQMRGTFELAQFMFCLITFSAFGYTQMMRGHIHVSIFINRFPPRAKYATAAIHFILSTIICCIATAAVFNMGSVASSIDKHSLVVELPYAPLYYVSAVLMAAFTVTVAFDVIRCIMAVVGNPDARASIDKIYA